MAAALKHMLKQMGREPESGGSPAFLAVLVFSTTEEISFFIHEFVLTLTGYLDLHHLKKTKTKLKKSRVNLLNAGYTKDVSSSKRVFIKI